jgi:hypothetical protein
VSGTRKSQPAGQEEEIKVLFPEKQKAFWCENPYIYYAHIYESKVKERGLRGLEA